MVSGFGDGRPAFGDLRRYIRRHFRSASGHFLQRKTREDNGGSARQRHWRHRDACKKFEGIFQIGDKIRAYDFKPCVGRPESFVEGTIINIQSDRGRLEYIIDCAVDSTSEGKWSRVGYRVYIPMEISFSEWDNRIQPV